MALLPMISIDTPSINPFLYVVALEGYYEIKISLIIYVIIRKKKVLRCTCQKS
jgi:hypothetical protein